MLSKYLTSSYLQYKQDTNAVASWLATTAKKCGYAVDLLTQMPGNEQQQNQPSTRLKGKARKLQREAKSGTPQSKTKNAPASPKGPTYTIAVKDFVGMADWIASQDKPPVHVPPTFVDCLTRAISVRRSHGQAVPRTDEKSDETHGYFIGILEHVRNVLRPRMSSEATEAATTEDNRFEGLVVQEPSVEFLKAPGPAPPKPAPVEANYEAEQLHDFEEAMLALQLLINDYHKFRDVITQTWNGYRYGVFDLVSSSLTTNTALDLTRRMEEDVKSLFDKFGGPEKMLQLYFIGLCIDGGEDEHFTERPGDQMNFRMYKQADSIFYPTYLFMQAYIAMVDERHCPEYKPGYYGVYDPSSDRSKKPAREQFKEDQILLAEFLSEAALFCRSTSNVPGGFSQEDEFLRGLRIAFKTHKIPLSLVFAGQVYLDVNHALRGDIARGFTDMRKVAIGINNSIESNLQFHASVRVETWPKSNDQAFKEIQSWVKYWSETDPLRDVKVRMRRQSGEPFKLMKSHPLFCGLLTYSWKMSFRDVSTAFINAWGSVLYTYHLYNACLQEELLGRGWKDLDLLMGLQGNVFVGGDRPKNADEYLQRFCLSMGVSAAAFTKSKSKRKNAPIASRTGPRGRLEELSPIAQMFKERFCKGSGQVDWMIEDVQKVVAQAEWDDEFVGDMFELTLDRKATQTENAAKKRTEISKLSAKQLLQRLRNGLQGEIMEFSMDYLLLHRSCWALLRTVNSNLESDLRDMFGVGYLEKENQLPFMVGFVLMAAAKTNKMGELVAGKTSDEVEIASKLMVKAASVMDGYIAREGGVMSKELDRRYNIMIADDSDSD